MFASEACPTLLCTTAHSTLLHKLPIYDTLTLPIKISYPLIHKLMNIQVTCYHAISNTPPSSTHTHTTYLARTLLFDKNKKQQ